MKNNLFGTCLLGLLLFVSPLLAQNPLESLLQNNPTLKKIVEQPQTYQVQICYTQINRDRNNKPIFTTYYHNVEENRYFYPASTVKLPIALLALEKLNELKIKDLDKFSPMTVDSAFTNQTAVRYDSTAANYKASVAHYVRKIFLTSDNDASNRLYEFVGAEEINQKLHQKGYKNVRIIHRLGVGDSEESAKYANPVHFYNQAGKEIYQRPLRFTNKTYPFNLNNLRQGIGYLKGDSVVNTPFDFSKRNYISLPTLHKILRSVIFPQETPAKNRFNLTEQDYQWVYKAMAMYPKESDYPKYTNPEENYDSFVKFLVFGSQKDAQIPANIRIFNKVGNAYGYLLDNAYVVDFATKTEFLLTAVIYVNADGIFNDNKYEYEEIGFPFLKALGQTILEYEQKRPKKYLPDLQRFNFFK